MRPNRSRSAFNDLIGRPDPGGEGGAAQSPQQRRRARRLGNRDVGGWNQNPAWRCGRRNPPPYFPAPIAMGRDLGPPKLVHTITGAMSDEARALYNCRRIRAALPPRPGLSLGR